MTESTILQWLNANPNWAGFFTFIISAAESVAIIGTIVPGSIMMAAIGMLAGTGIVPLWSIIAWAILGAIVGDGISYWFGYHYKSRLHYMWPFKRYPQILEKGEYFFKSHGGKSVFIGRFVGPVRALVPLVAGMFGMQPLKFIIANVTSAILWAPAYMLPGILLGAAAMELPSDIATHALIMLLLTLLMVVLIIWIIIKTITLMSTQINSYLNKLWGSLQHSRHFKKITTVLKHHDPKQTHGQLTLAFYVLITFIIFTSLAVYVYMMGSQNIFINKIFFYLSRSLRTPSVDDVMLMFTLLGQSVVLLPAIFVVIVYTYVEKHYHTTLHILGLIIAAPIINTLVKYLIHSPRPWGDLQIPVGFSFPSGHSVLSATFYFGITILFIHEFKIKRKWPIFLFVGLLVFFVGISRVYLGVHWFTDVLGGWILSALLLMITVLSYNRNKESKPVRLYRALGIFLFSLFVLYSIYYFSHITILRKNYSTIGWPIYTIPADSWWQQKGENIPLFRLNRLGAANDVLNIQWVGDINTIKKILLQNGWEEPPQTNWITALYRITDVKSSEHLPLVSTLYLDKSPVLLLTRHAANGEKKLVVLRLWDSNLILIPSKQPLWVGSVEFSPRTYSWLFNTKRHKISALTSNLIFKKVPVELDVKVQQVTMKNKKRPQNYSIILIRPKPNTQRTPL